ncbi:hypothetical protein CYR34_05560, partial [Chimaeribacter arupi]
TLSDDTGVAGDNQTNDTTPGFAITTDSDVVTVMVSIDGGAPQAAVQDAAGQWHFVTPSTLSDGEHSLIVMVTDVAGNSISGEAFAFTVDTSVNIPTIDLNDVSDSGADVADNITNVTTPTFTLSNIDADAVTVEVLINGTIYPATKTGETWSFTAPELADGEYAVQVNVTDDAGNTATSAALTITVDTAITAPVVTLSDDTGVAGDNQTNDTTPGFAIATDSDVVTVMVSIDGGAPQAATQNAAGQWHFVTSSTLSDGEHSLIVTATDVAGNSISGEAFAFTVDTTVNIPVIDLNDASDSGADSADNITNVKTPTFTLSNIDADAVTVEVLINGTLYPATLEGGVWRFTAPELADGEHAVQVIVTDDAGNTATSAALNITVDTAVNAPVITLSDDTGVAGDNQTNDTTPGFAIATDADVVTVMVSIDGAVPQAAVQDAAGQWHFVTPSVLADGEHSLIVTATDVAGNSTSGEAFAFTVDTTVNIPTIDLDDASDSGADSVDNITNVKTPTFTLSNIDADAVTVEVLINGTVYPATKTGENWSFTAPELADGEYAVQVSVTDDAGNTATSAALNITVDTAITAPVITLSDDTGVTGDSQTNDTTPGFAIATDADVVTVMVSIDGGAPQAAVQDAAGQWHFVTPSTLTDGEHNLVVTVTDVAGNSTSGEAFAFTVDTTVNIPVIDLDDASDTGANAADNITHDITPTFTLNNVDADAVTVEVLINGTVYPATKTGETWSFTAPELADGEYAVQVSVTDDAGNTAISTATAVLIDTAISAPVITLSDDTGVAGDNQTNDTTPGFAITTDSDVVTVMVSIDGGAPQAAVQDAAGQWHFVTPSTLSDGEHSLIVTVTDVAGNSLSGEAFAFTVDTTVNIPTIDLNDVSDSGADSADNITNVKTPTFTLNNIDADAVTVEVLINGTIYPAIKTGETWSFTAPELADGEYAVQVNVTDDAGNTATSAALNITVDTAITAPVITLSDDTGVQGDTQTNDTTPGFAIATDADVVTVMVSIDGAAPQAAVQDAAGQWHFVTPSALADGEHSLIVTVTDVAGNSLSGEAFAFTVDTTVNIPTIDLNDASDSGADSVDNITNVKTPTFTLSNIDADAMTVEVLINGTAYPARLEGGVWRFTAPELADGEHAVQVIVTDDAGNTATSAALNITVDTTINAPIVTLSDDSGVQGDSQTNDTTPGFAITTDSDVVTVMVSIDGGAPQAAVQDAAGQWHFVTPSALSDGEHSLIVTVTDVAGNSTSGEAFAFTVDTTVTTPAIDLDDASDTGANAADNITHDTTPTFTLNNVDADAVTVGVLINGITYAATQEGGVWRFTAPELTDGEYTVQVSVTDDAGNSAISTSTAVLIDTAINAPVITLLDDSGVPGDNQTNDTTPGFAIATDSDVVTVMVSIDGGAPQAAVQDAAGQWHFAVPSALSDGEHNLVVTVTDNAGNSLSGEAFAFTIDTTVTLPVIDLNDVSDSGADSADNITNVKTPSFTLSNIDADAVTVEVLINGTLYPATLEGGVWRFTAPELTDGEHAVQVIVTDHAGNTATSAALTITVDTAITAPVITLSDDTGVAGDNQTNDTTPGFAITTDSDVVTVMVSIDGGAPQAATQDAAGQWHFVTPSALSDGEHSLIVTVTDVAGNSISAEAFAFTVDTTVTLPVIDLVEASDSGAENSDNITNVKTPSFTLSNIDADAVTVEVLINGTVYPATKTGETWSFTAPELADGEYAVPVSVTDDAGNTATSAALNVTIDTTVNAPVVTLSDDTGVAGDNQTNDAMPGFAIVTDTDVVTVMVSVDGTAAQAAVRDAAGQWHFAVPSALNDGEHSLVVTVTDNAGNSTRGDAFAFTVDTTLSIPTLDLDEASDSGAASADNITNVNNPAFTLGNIDADAVKVEVLINGTAYPVMKTGDTWHFTAPELADGDYAVQVRVTDDAGNVAASAALNVTVDTVTNAPVITLMDDSGVVGDNQTSDTTPGFAIITDTDVVTVMVSVDGGAAQAAVQDAAGRWTFAVPSALTDGEHTLDVTVTDKAGNSTQGAAYTFTLDTSVSVPAIDLNEASDSGAANSDNITNVKTPSFTLSNIDADAVTVEVLINGTAYPATREGGVWRFTAPELTDGEYAVQVRVTDDAGNTATSGELTFTVDTEVAPVTLALVAESDTGSSVTDGVTRDTTPAFTFGQLPEDAAGLTLVLSNGAEYEIDLSAGRAFTLPAALEDGTYTATAIITDIAGNTATSTLGFTVDTQLTVPVIELAQSSDSGMSAHDNVTRDTTPAFVLSNLDADVVKAEVLINGIAYPATKAGDSWHFTAPALVDGDYTVQVRVSDVAGNTADSAPLSVTIDTVTHEPVITLSDDSGVAGDNQTNDKTPGFAIATDADVVTVMVSVDGGVPQAAVRDAAGQWHFTVPAELVDGQHKVTATVTDLAGNTHHQSLDFTVDSTLSLPTLALNSQDDTGISNSDSLTNNTQPAFRIGNLDADVAAITLTVDGKTWPVPVSQGTATFTLPESLADGTYTVQVTVTDDAGNARIVTLPLEIDTQTRVDGIVLNDDTGTLNDWMTNTTGPQFTITAPDDAQAVMVSVDGGEAIQAVYGEQGWVIDLPQGLAEGEHTLTVTVTDNAGNTATQDQAFTVDTTLAPLVVDMLSQDDSGVADDNITNETMPRFALTGVPEDVLSVFVTLNGVSYPVTAQSDGSWIFTPPAGLADGNYQLLAVVNDQAGNQRTTAFDFVIDTSVSVDLITLQNDTGISAVDNITHAEQPKFRVTTSDDVVSMTATLNGMACSVTKTADGEWSVTSPVLSTSGDYTLVVQVTDVAGNASTASTVITFDNQLSQPVVAFAPGDDTGADAADHLTGKNRPGFVISNIDDDVVNMTIMLDGKTVQVKQDGTGNWVFTPDQALSDGSYTMVVNVTDRAGNTHSQDFTFVVDTTVSKPVITLVAQSDTGDSQTDRLTNDTKPQFSFSNIDPDVYTLQVVLNGITYDVAKNAQGEWQWTAPELAAGSYTLTAIVTDKAGNLSTQSLSFVVDTFVRIDGIEMSEDTGYSGSDHLTSDTRPAFTVRVADDVSHVYASLDGGARVSLTKHNGKWVFNCPEALPDGAHSLAIEVNDKAGNSATQHLDFVVDTTLAPVTVDLRDPDDSGISEVDNYTRTTQPVFVFTGIPADAHSLTVRLGGQTYTVNLSSTPVRFTPPAALQDGAYTLEVQVTDKAGNVKDSAIAFTIDTQTAVSVDFAVGDDTGRSDSDNCTTQNMPTFNITVPEDVVTVMLVLDNGAQTPVVKDATGKWQFTAPALADGHHTLVVSVTDKAGNTAQTSLDFTVDTTLNIPQIALADDTGYLNNDNLINDATPKFTISNVESDVWSVTVLLNGKSYQAEKVNGGWACQIPDTDALEDGQHTATVRIEDQAGNTRFNTLDFIVDTQCPPPEVSLREMDNSGDAGDNVTNVTQPRIIINNVPDDIYQVSVSLGGKTWQADPQAGYWDIPDALEDGTHAIVVSYTDKAGNSSSTTYSFVVDTQVLSPGLALLDDTGSNVTDNLTCVTAPRFEITAAETLVAVNATLNGVTTAVTPEDGRWIFTAETLADGSYTLQVELIDIAGNRSVEVLTFTVDTQIPVPVIDMQDASDSGMSATDNITNQPQPLFVISNVPEDVDSVRVEINGTSYQATFDGVQWTVQPNSLPDGEHTATVTVRDKAGNQAESSVSLVVDTQILLSVEMETASDSGVSQTDQLTNDTTPGFHGKTDSNAHLVMTIKDVNGLVVQTVEQDADGEGNWVFTAAGLVDGPYTLNVMATDVAGNSIEQNVRFTIDTKTEAPTVGLAQSEPDNSHEALNLAPEFKGTAEPGATLTIRIDGNVVASITASSSGAWAWTPPGSLLSGDHVIAVTATDRAGNTSPETSFGFIIPVIDLDPPTITLTSDTDSGALGDFITNSVKPTLTGITLPGVTVTIYVNNVAAGQVQSDSTGRYTFALPVLEEGTYNVQAAIIDPNTLQELRSDGSQLVVDTHVAALDWAMSGAKEGYVNDSTPTLTGSTEPGAQIKIFVDGQYVIETHTSSEGSWTVTLPAITGEGEHRIHFEITDLAGNTVTTPAETFILDTYISTLTINLDDADDTGRSTTDLITNKTQVQLEGIAEAGSTLTLSRADGTFVADVMVAEDGTWHYTVDLKEGANGFIALAEDKAGNKTQKDLVIQCDTQNSLSDVALARSSNSGDAYDLVTNDTSPTLSAMTDPGASVDIYIDDVKVATVMADASGAVSYTLPESVDGSYAVRFESTDMAGNTATSATSVVVIDSAVVGFDMAAPPELSNKQSIKLTGTGEANATVTVKVNGEIIGSATVDADGNWSMPVGLGKDGEYVISATMTDIAGNQASTQDYHLTLDTVTNYPTLKLDEESNSASKSDNITRDNTPRFHGTAEAGATVSILVDEVVVATVTADANGLWAWEPAEPMKDGEYSLRVTAEDQAGNTADSARILVTIDTATAIQINGMDSDNGLFSNDSVTSSARPRFDITGEKGQSVTVYIDGKYVETFTLATADAKYTVPDVLPDGSHSLRFEITDAAGNTAASNTKNFVIDTVNTTPIELTGINGESVESITHNGVIYLSDLSRNATLTGQAEAGSKMTILVNGLTVTEAWANADGVWSADIPQMVLRDGEMHFKFISRDRGGNVNEATMTIVVDTRITTFSVDVQDNKSSAADKWALSTTTPTFFGRGEAGATVTLFVAGMAMASAVVGQDGLWTMTVPELADGTYALSFTIADPAGNTQTIVHNAVIDTQGPAAPVVDNSLYLDANGLWVMSGKGEAGSRILIKNQDGEVIASAAVDKYGNWNAVFTYPEAGKASVQAEDAAGNLSPAVQFDIMRSVPGLALDTASDGGRVGDKLTNDATPTLILGNIESDVTQVVVTVNGQSYHAAKNEAGTWTLTLGEALPDGTWPVTVTVTDGAGNTQSATVSLVIDQTLAAPVVTLEGDAEGDFITSKAAPVLLLSNIDADVTRVVVTVNEVDYEVVQADGVWRLALTEPLAEGSWPVTVTVTDAAGNTATTTTSLVIDQSTSAPGVAIEGDAGGDMLINTATPTLLFSNIDADVTQVAVTVNGATCFATQTDGVWRLTLPEPLGEGTWPVTVTVTDAAGNTASTDTALVVDLSVSAPEVALEGDAEGDFITNKATPTLLLSNIDADATQVAVTVNGATCFATQSDGVWRLTLPEPLAEGTWPVTVTVTDAAGNTASTTTALVIDQSVTAPRVAVEGDDGGDMLINTATPTLLFDNIDADVTQVAVTVNGATCFATQADGGWRLTLPDALAEGTWPITVTVTDAAGNTASTDTALVIDQTLSQPGVSAGADPDGNHIINDTTPGFVFTDVDADADSVTVSLNGNAYDAVKNELGEWTFSPLEPLADGDYHLVITATDKAGNQATSEPYDFRVDTRIEAFDAQLVANRADQPDEWRCESSTLGLRGHGEAGATVTVSLDGGEAVTRLVDENGQWSVELNEVADGTHALVLNIVDTAGNSQRIEHSVTVDTSSPKLMASMQEAPEESGPASGGHPHAAAVAGADMMAGSMEMSHQDDQHADY